MVQAISTTPRSSSARDAAPPVAYGPPPYGLALLAGALVFTLYAITLAPTTAFWDTSEYIATGHILGIPHPPGNPLFVVMARAWELLLSPTGVPSAVRINLFSAVVSAGAAVFWYLIVHRILAYFTANETARRVGAGVSVLVSATAFTVWNQSNVNEKVYLVTLLSTAFLSWLAFRWRDHVEAHRGTSSARWHDENVLVLMVFVLALSEGNHRMAWLVAPALFVMIYLVKAQVLLNWRLYAWSALFAVIGLSVQMYLPIRAALNPVINEAAPVCPEGVGSAMQSIVTFGRAGCEALGASLRREQYQKPPVSERLAPFGDQLTNYFQYFDWQWARSLMGNIGYFGAARLPFTLLFLTLGIYGAWRHYQRDRTSFWYIATLFGTLSVGLVFYMNFKYGFGQANANGLSADLAEVRERDYFFLISFSVWGLWAGIGITALWLRAMERFAGQRNAPLMGSPVLLLAFIPLVLNWPYASRGGDYAARDWAYNLLMSVEPYGVLFTNGDNDTFPLWYLQEVEGIRKDVTVIVWSYLNTPWYARQIRELTTPCRQPGDAAREPTRIVCQRAFDPKVGQGIYGAARYPTRGILPLQDAEIDLVTQAGYMQVGSDVTFEARGIQAQFPAGTIIAAADQFILAIVKQAWGDRPVYFAATTNAHRKLGLDAYVARQGVAYKLLTPQETRAPGMQPMPQNDQYSVIYGAYMDVPRTQKLLSEVFVYRNLADRAHWTDDATRGIPTYYGFAHLALAAAHELQGNSPAMQQHVQRYQKWMELAER